jgi:hypothetical protein
MASHRSVQPVHNPCILVKHIAMEISAVLPWVLHPTRLLSCQALVFISIFDPSMLHLLTLVSLRAIVLSRHTWVFCQASKSPSIFIIEHFLALNGLRSGPRFLRMDKGGEIWRSNQLR